MTTVRSQDKAEKIKEAHPNVPKSRLDFAIVEDIAQEHAFDHAVKSDPPFEAVIHTASPFHFNVTDVQKQLLDPAIIGTTGILRSIKAYAPAVKRVVITSSFAAILDPAQGLRPGYVYSEKDWNSITQEEAVQNPSNGYRGRVMVRTFARPHANPLLSKQDIRGEGCLGLCGKGEAQLHPHVHEPSVGHWPYRQLPQFPRGRQHVEPAHA